MKQKHSSYVKIGKISDEVAELHPLLDKLLINLPRVVGVEYTHGPTEMGADFILIRQDDVLLGHEYVGIIAKVGKVVQNYADIDRQIEECAVPRPVSGGGKRVRLGEVWVFTTGSITRGAKEKIYDKYKTRKVTFFDGRRLAKLVDDHLPNYWTDVPLETGDYLASLRTRNQEADKGMSLLDIPDKSFYIQQDIFESWKSKHHKLRKKREVFDIGASVQREQAILIEAAAGGGKSKLLREILDFYSRPETFCECRLLPLSFTYKDFVDKYDENVERAIETQVSTKIRDENKDLKFLLLIDALDEKNISEDHQTEALASLFGQAQEKPGVHVLLTSRFLKGLGDSEETRLAIRRYEIHPLSTEKTILFIRALCAVEDSGRLFEDLKRSEIFKSVPRNPIAIIILAKLINEQVSDLPATLSELYSKYVELMLGRWDMAKGLQSQKDYQALDNIMINISCFLVDNELDFISRDEFLGFFKTYLSERNLGVKPEPLFRSLLNRCDLLELDSTRAIVSFKHRTFAEFLYARSMHRDGKENIVKGAFRQYWMYTVFFYIGLKKDAPRELRQLVDAQPKDSSQRWLKMLNMGNYLLAGFASPYETIVYGLEKTVLEFARLCVNLLRDRDEDKDGIGLMRLSRMDVLASLVYFVRKGYSYVFFREAIEEAALRIDASGCGKETTAYALLFLSVAYAEIGNDDPFDLLLKDHSKDLPIEIMLFIRAESRNLKKRSRLLKKLDKRTARLWRGKEHVFEQIVDRYYSRPLRESRS